MIFPEQERMARLRLARSTNIGPVTFFRLINKYGSAESAIKSLLKFKSKYSERIPSLDEVIHEIKLLENLGGQFIFLGENLYPEPLAMITDPPPVISVIGNPVMVQKLSDINIFAVVGSRSCSYNSSRLAYNISKDLSSAGITVVSGLARGIDAQAHKGALASASGSIAVLACGLGSPPYPPENKELYKQLLEDGIIISEMPIEDAPQSVQFPRRNRIIAGLAHGILVVEAADKSGSLITAKYALDYNRDVYAIPGFPLDPRCVGTNRLLKNGAILVESVSDILNNYTSTMRPQKILRPVQDTLEFTESAEAPYSNSPVNGVSAEPDLNAGHLDKKSAILGILGSNPVFIEDLASEFSIPINEVLSILTELELDNKITVENGQQVSLLI